MAKYYSIVYMYHSFFIHSPVNGYLGCFHVLANSAAMNSGVHVFLFYFFLKFWCDPIANLVSDSPGSDFSLGVTSQALQKKGL